ncbi:MAG: hypothetical protein CFH22_00446 [Alphaproteobacteria bacterium MarineAlpha5_Bin12]|nr:hypothetical protein [Pelagibacteraceae bacterium]PPR41898.1 MAG: hypothetical protein CFH22_00446 [Alphaproteobacteria bacterium MarineAlpha5_Bin12]|tara:strand:- start:1634 stop:1882 length:249 start_codon:yes stop_codon:yes gene_type:complete
MINYKNNLKKKILFRLIYTGTKESDILFKKYFINKIEDFNLEELNTIIQILSEFSDTEILSLLKKETINNKYDSFINKIIEK